MKEAVLEQQIVDNSAQKRLQNTTLDVKEGSSLSNYAASLTLEACQCRHLQKWLPHIIDLKCIPVTNRRRASPSSSSSWAVVNPVHALHLASLLQEPSNGSIPRLILPKGHLAHTIPSLFGDEQRRTNAILSPGLSSAYCPLVGPDEETTEPYIIHKAIPALPKPKQAKPSEESATNVAPLSSSSVPTGNDPTAPVTTSGLLPTPPTASSLPENPKTSPPPEAVPAPPALTLSASPKQTPPVLQAPPPISSSASTLVSPSAMTAGATTTSNDATETTPKEEPTSTSTKAPFLLSDDRYQELRRMEELILQQQRSLLTSKRKAPPVETAAAGTSSTSAKSKKSTSGSNKKRKTATTSSTSTKSSSPTTTSHHKSDLGSAQFLPGSYLSTLTSSSSSTSTKTQPVLDKKKWEQDAIRARTIVSEWMERYRLCRHAYWDKRQEKKESASLPPFGALSPTPPTAAGPSCVECEQNRRNAKASLKYVCNAVGDEVFQCLECSFVGCGPLAVKEDSRQHILHHLLETGHGFAVSCGSRAEVYCFHCGDFVYHSIFDRERERIDIARNFPWMGWEAHPVQRSFDPFQFVTTSDHGVVWRGLVASYPSSVPDEHRTAAQLSLRRRSIFCGDLLADRESLAWGPKALELASYQQTRGLDYWRIDTPVGMYNLGNTCFLSSVVNVIVHCVPLQRHFLLDIRHNHKSCQFLRGQGKVSAGEDTANSSPTVSTTPGGELAKPDSQDICVACELDILFLQYYGSSVGLDALEALREPLRPTERYKSTSSTSPDDSLEENVLRGEPLIISDFLTAAWRSGGMNHLAGYDQRDAHEFLQAFLDIIGKHAHQHYERVSALDDRDNRSSKSGDSGEAMKRESAQKDSGDFIKGLFEGSLRSVLICEECGSKRSYAEVFVNISLPISKQVEEPKSAAISIQQCLKVFTDPEALTDSVHCAYCEKKTATKKQHTFARLPRVLCLHLKRFDAAKNKKIGDFVSFPEYALDMGSLLPHWREVQQWNTKAEDGGSSSPRLLYDLFGTVNHTGTMNQGHYMSNVKVHGQWYHCNDAHVSKVKADDVLATETAYMLFYIRR